MICFSDPLERENIRRAACAGRLRATFAVLGIAIWIATSRETGHLTKERPKLKRGREAASR